MRSPIIVAFALVLLATPSWPQPARTDAAGQGGTKDRPVGREANGDVAVMRVTIPPHDLRRTVLRNLETGDAIEAEFQVSTPAGKLELEILRRNDSSRGNRSFEVVASFPAAENIKIHQPVSRAGDYVLVLRQPPASRRPLEAAFAATVHRAGDRIAGSPARTLSPQKRLAVLIFSLGLLWTTLLVCGAPIIRAFRSRRTPETPAWFG